jgi:uncharacterized membrane protein
MEDEGEIRVAISSNRLLGFSAALLIVIGSIPALLNTGRYAYPFSNVSSVGISLPLAILSFVGLILFLVAMNGLANDYQDRGIFNNALYSFISGIMVGVAAGVIAVLFLLSNLGNFIPSTGPPAFSTDFFESLIDLFVPVLPIVSVLNLIPAVFNLRAFNRLAAKSEVRLFRITGLLGVVAAVVTILLGFLAAALFYAAILSASSVFTVSVAGSAISLVAWIVAAAAFWSINENTSQAVQIPTPQNPTQPTGQVKYCPYCGAANVLNAEYCVHCGKKQ